MRTSESLVLAVGDYALTALRKEAANPALALVGHVLAGQRATDDIAAPIAEFGPAERAAR